MENPAQPPKDDIVQQPYKGPSQLAAGLGEGAVQTKFLTIAGLIGGGVAAAIFHKPAIAFVEKIHGGIKSAIESSHPLKKFGAHFANLFLDLGKHVAELLQNIGIVKNHLGKYDQTRVKTVVDSAIIGSAVAGFFGSLFGGSQGVLQARAGRKQFEQAKTEIATLRGTLGQTQAELEDAKTTAAARKGELKVAGDEPPPVAATEPGPAAEHPPTASWASEIAAQKEQKSEASLG